MKKKKTSPSVKKFIRLEKARIRRTTFDFKKQKELILELYREKTYENKRNL